LGATMGGNEDGADRPTEVAGRSAQEEKTVLAAPPLRQGLKPGDILSHTYAIDRLIARGGMGEVYRARHIELGSWHAIKVILSELAQDPTIVNLFRREGQTLRQLRHEALVAYDGLFRDEQGRVYLVMEFVDGPSLGALIKERPLAPG